MAGEPLTPSNSFAPLNEREHDILVLLAQNLSNREIADRLFLAYNTVKWYNRQIFSKLGVETREQAVARAFALNLLKSLTPEASSINSLPVQLTPFIGRVSELDDLTELLSTPGIRFVTILAPGGMGKTRLALAAAENIRGQFEEGVYFVPLAPLTAHDQIVVAIADALGLHFFSETHTLKQQLLDFLQSKRVLLVLDNFEHLLEGATLVADLLNGAPTVKVIATARERLNLLGETVYTLGGLPYPAQVDTENLFDYGAMKLFVQCARQANSRYVADDVGSIIRICQLVQGMPLALELAAAWMTTLSSAEIADEIERSADFLRTTMRNAPERLRSIRGVFEATWRRLTHDERQAFRRMSIFRGGCTREAAQTVAGAELLTLAGLVDKALLWHHPQKGRYEIHELLRQYAVEQLEAAGEADIVQTTHRDYFSRLAQKWGKALKTPKQMQALNILDADFDNLRAAFQRAIETGKPEIIEPFTELWYFYEIRERNAEGSKIFGMAIEVLKGHDSIALGKLLVGQAIFHERFYQYDQERLLAQEGVAILRRLGADSEMAFPLAALGVGLSHSGYREDGVIIFYEALEIAQRYHDQWVEAILLVCLGGYAASHKRFDEAKTSLTQAYTLVRRLDNQWAVAFVVRDLAYLAYREGDYEEAKRLFETGLASAQKLHHLTTACHNLNGLRQVAIAQGALVQARRYGEETLKIERSLGNRTGIYWRLIGLAEVAIAAGSSQETRVYLREALQMFDGFGDPFLMVDFGITASEFLAQTDSMVQAVILISFLMHQSKPDSLSETVQLKLQKLATQLQSQLPADSYDAASQQGQTVTLADLVTLLQRVI